mgnify:CR=1 FL=1
MNSTEVAYGFGQMGSAYLSGTSAYTPPTGKIIVAITFIGAGGFTTLTGDTSLYGQADGGLPTNASNPGTAFIQTTAVVANGTGAVNVPTGGSLFPEGVTLFGRWTTLTLSGGSAVLYLADVV